MAKKDTKLARAGVSGYNKPKKTPGHPTKSHIVVAKVGNKTKTIRFKFKCLFIRKSIRDRCAYFKWKCF